jgi:hypothetical protein
MGFTLQDLGQVRDRAIKNFIATPSRSRLPGMDRDLNADENRILALVEAAVVVILAKSGVAVSNEISEQLPKPFTATQEPIEGYDVVFSGKETSG